MRGGEIVVEVKGIEELRRKYAELGSRTTRVIARAMYRVAERTITRAKREFVPVVTGALRASGHARLPVIIGNLAVEQTLGFGGPSARYAFIVHENPRAGKTGGRSPSGRKYKRWSRVGQWKFLETPAAQARKQLMDEIENALSQAANGRP